MHKPPPPALTFHSPEYHDLIGLIYDAINGDGGFFPFLEQFIKTFDGHSASFSIYDTQAKTMIGHWLVNIPEHALAFYAEHIAHQDALVNAALTVSAENGQPCFVASNLDLGENGREIRKQIRADEWLASFGACEAAGAVTYQSDNYLNFFAIQRAADQPDFTREQLAIFDLFLPHLNRAVGLYTQMSALSQKQTPEKLALEQIQRGILICDAGYKIVFRNSTADEIIASNTALTFGDEGFLIFQDKDFANRFMLAISKAMKASIQHMDVTETILRYQQGSQHLTMIISPLATASNENGSDNCGGVMICLYDWSVRPQVNADTLRHFFGLTEVEAVTSALLVQGCSPAEIAKTTNRSRETVKTHLSSIFRKTSTTRQSELVALLCTSSAFG